MPGGTALVNAWYTRRFHVMRKSVFFDVEIEGVWFCKGDNQLTEVKVAYISKLVYNCACALLNAKLTQLSYRPTLKGNSLYVKPASAPVGNTQQHFFKH